MKKMYNSPSVMSEDIEIGIFGQYGWTPGPTRKRKDMPKGDGRHRR